MVPMPSKTRTAVTVGAVLLVAIIGAFWFWLGTRGTNATPPTPTDSALYEEPPVAVAPVTTPSTPTESDVTAAPQDSVAEHTIPETYTVQPGETLEDICLRFYGDKNLYGVVERFNRETLSNPDVVRAGTTIKLPRWNEMFPGEPATTGTEQSTPQFGGPLPLDPSAPASH